MIAPSASFDELVACLLTARREGKRAPVLFLGRGVAQAAGVPSVRDMASDLRPVIDEQCPELRALASQGEDGLLGAFYEYWARLSPIERRSMLLRYYSRVPIPAFYQDLAWLLASRHFVSVLTTNIDTLLDQALNAAGLRAGSDYQAISLTAERGEGMRSEMGADEVYRPYDPDARPLRIVKLHGDLSLKEVAITPEEVEDFLAPYRREVKGELLAGDVVLVGYSFESEPINQWLAWTSGRLWWVDRERPGPDDVESIEKAHRVDYVDGSNGVPAEFFGLLHIRLIQEAAAATPPDAREMKGEPPPASMSRGLQSPSDNLEETLLRQKLAQSQSRLRQLEQQAYSSANVQLEVQIQYERDQIAEIENRLRSLSYNPSQVIGLVDAVVKSVRKAGADPSLTSFIRKQAATLKAEYKRTPPSQDVIGAALGATLFAAGRLGPKVVDPQLLTRLAEMAPSSAGSGVWIPTSSARSSA